ncbi:SAM-dependent O-methyltransferase [Reticulomyxa filosa]|uniref:SAM-dependent O-methyltransferase n=1 Tax=Reticulomyxa filosa TaxID=46433 RepID=X6N4T7_RETFI|nr:SAM-dependent O-methyltransferase [Reticulomyxa filosa]|eukprot:ETO21041.1 SAM-dependent O-methyltransferase [Reticulomyxa filosa]
MRDDPEETGSKGPPIDIYDTYRISEKQKQLLREQSGTLKFTPTYNEPKYFRSPLPEDLVNHVEHLQTLVLLRECARLNIFDSIPHANIDFERINNPHKYKYLCVCVCVTTDRNTEEDSFVKISIEDLSKKCGLDKYKIYRILRALSFVDYTTLSYEFVDEDEGHDHATANTKNMKRSEKGSDEEKEKEKEGEEMDMDKVFVRHTNSSVKYTSKGYAFPILMSKTSPLNALIFEDWKLILQSNRPLSLAEYVKKNKLFGDNALYHTSGFDTYFNLYMLETAKECRMQIANNFDFSQVLTVADIGGGLGHVLSTLLHRNPELYGYLLETRNVIKDAKEYIAKNDKTNHIGGRIEFVCADFLSDNHDDAVPIQADVYLLKWILHDHSDKSCLKILKNIQAAATQTDSKQYRPRLLIVEQLLPDSKHSLGSNKHLNFMDIHLMAMYGGKERTLYEYDKLCRQSGFERVGDLRNVKPVGAFHMIEYQLQ